MRRNSIIILLAMAVLLSTAALAQRTDRVTTTTITATANGWPPTDAIIKPSFKMGDLKSVILMLQEVEIRPVEVDVFLGVQKVLVDAAKAAAASGGADDAVTTVEMQAAQAQNLGFLLGRVKAKGTDSTIINDISAAVGSAAAQWQTSPQKK